MNAIQVGLGRTVLCTLDDVTVSVSPVTVLRFWTVQSA